MYIARLATKIDQWHAACNFYRLEDLVSFGMTPDSVGLHVERHFQGCSQAGQS